MGLMSVLFPSEAGRLANLERRMAALEARVGVPEAFEDPALAPVIDELRAGREIKAVQVYQSATDCSLTEARVAVQDLKERIGY